MSLMRATRKNLAVGLLVAVGVDCDASAIMSDDDWSWSNSDQGTAHLAS